LVLRHFDTEAAASFLKSEQWYGPIGPELQDSVEHGFRVLAANIIAPVELKNASQFMAKHWEAEPPIVYSLQLQHQMLVADARVGYMVASIGGQPPVWAEQMADGEVRAVLMSAYDRFWQSVMENYDVPADYREVTSKAISARFAKDDGSTVKLGEDALLAWKNYRRALDSGKANEQAKSEHANNLKRLMGSATFAVLPDGTEISWKADKNGNRRQIRLVGEEPEGVDDGWGGL
jgi:predicted phage-related endonuclease